MPRFSARWPGRLDRGAVGHRVGKRHADLDQVGAGTGEALEQRERGFGVGIAGCQVNDEPGAALLAQLAKRG